MSEAKNQIPDATKVRVLRMIEASLQRCNSPTLRACGLTEKTIEALKVEDGEDPIVDLFITKDDGSDLDRFRVNKITDTGLGLMALADTAPNPPIPISMVSKPQSFKERAYKGLWELTKAAISAAVGWILKGCNTPT